MNMKPSWDDAPEWAQWLAMDSGGDWYWYENLPTLLNYIWSNVGDDDSRYEVAFRVIQHWRNSLEERP